MGRAGKVYRRVRANFTDAPANFSWVIPGKLAGSGRPYSKRQIDWMKSHGITNLLSLSEDPLPEGWLDGLEFRHFPLDDHAPVEPAKMKEAADYLDLVIRDGKAVAVHCLAGKGRTGTVLAAYLMAYGGRTADEALHELREGRPGSVERPQEPGVREFEGYLKGAGSGARARGTTDQRRPL